MERDVRAAVVSAAALPSPAPSYGGLESIAAYVAEALADVHDVTMFAAKGSHTTKAKLFETVEAAYEPSLDHPVEFAAWNTMKDLLPQFDVVVDMSHSFHAYRLKLAHPDVRVIKVVHDLMPWASAPPDGSYDVLAGVSKFHARVLAERWGVPVTHLYNGIPTEQLIYREQKEPYLLYLSRIDYGKGAHTFLELVATLKCPAIIAGDDNPQHGIDPRYRRMVCRKAVELGVDYRGEVSDQEKKELLAHARAILVPLADPYREVFGIWIIEALASGTPVWTLDKGACRELVTPQCGGVATDVNYLLTGLEMFQRNEFGFQPQACREQAQKFDIHNTVQAYEARVTELRSPVPR